MMSHGPAVNPVDSNDIVPIRDPICRRDHFVGDVIDECHVLLPGSGAAPAFGDADYFHIFDALNDRTRP
jgi:hypothetical protein